MERALAPPGTREIWGDGWFLAAGARELEACCRARPRSSASSAPPATAPCRPRRRQGLLLAPETRAQQSGGLHPYRRAGRTGGRGGGRRGRHGLHSFFDGACHDCIRCGLTSLQANATSLAAISATGVGSCAFYNSNSYVDWWGACLIACSAACFSPLGAKVVTRLSEATIKKSFGLMLLGCAPLLFLKKFYLQAQTPKAVSEQPLSPSSSFTLPPPASSSPFPPPAAALSAFPAQLFSSELPASSGAPPPPPLRQALVYLGVGSLTGFISGAMGIGGGLILTSALALTTQIDHHTILGTSLISMVPPSITGTLAHLRYGNVVVKLVPGLCAGALVGSYIGAQLASQVEADYLVLMVCFVMGLQGIKTVRSISKLQLPPSKPT
eukprot:g79037.t1